MIFPEEKRPYVQRDSYTQLRFLTGECNRSVHCPVPPVTPLNLISGVLGSGQGTSAAVNSSKQFLHG